MKRAAYILFLLILVAGCHYGDRSNHTFPSSTMVDYPEFIDGNQFDSIEQIYPEFVYELLSLHNDERVRMGLPRLQLDASLMSYAQNHAQWMASANRLRHSNLNFDFSSRAENIAWNYDSPLAVMVGWMNSYGHKANILGRSYRYVGFGLARNSSGETYWCVVFGG